MCGECCVREVCCVGVWCVESVGFGVWGVECMRDISSINIPSFFFIPNRVG